MNLAPTYAFRIYIASILAIENWCKTSSFLHRIFVHSVEICWQYVDYLAPLRLVWVSNGISHAWLITYLILEFFDGFVNLGPTYAFGIYIAWKTFFGIENWCGASVMHHYVEFESRMSFLFMVCLIFGIENWYNASPFCSFCWNLLTALRLVGSIVLTSSLKWHSPCMVYHIFHFEIFRWVCEFCTNEWFQDSHSVEAFFRHRKLM